MKDPIGFEPMYFCYFYICGILDILDTVISKIPVREMPEFEPKKFQTHLTFFCFRFSEEKFKKIDEEFTKCNTFLVSCLGNIAKRGAFPHCK